MPTMTSPIAEKERAGRARAPVQSFHAKHRPQLPNSVIILQYSEVLWRAHCLPIGTFRCTKVIHNVSILYRSFRSEGSQIEFAFDMVYQACTPGLWPGRASDDSLGLQPPIEGVGL